MKNISSTPETHCLNYIPISENIASSGQPNPTQFDAIAEAGFKHIINLAMHDSTDSLYDEGGLVSEAGMNYFHIPVPFDAPTIKHLKLFLNLMTMLEDDKIWVHCAYNWRASAFINHYQRSIFNLAPETIEMPILEQWKLDEVWQKFLKLELDERTLQV